MEVPVRAVVPSSILRSPGRPVPAKVLLLAKLVERFIPSVAAIVRPQAMAGIRSLMVLITERAPEIREHLASIEDGTASLSRRKAFAACGVGLRPLSVETLRNKIAWSIEDAVEGSSFALVLGWLDAFPRPKCGGLAIDVDKLDGAMLPRLDEERRRRFAEACRKAGLSVEGGRGVLAAVRANLAPGEHLPDEAAQMLDASLISISQ